MASSEGANGTGQEGVYRILSAVRAEGIETAYLCMLQEGGKKVKRSATELKELAPRLLAEFEAAQSSRTSPNLSSDASVIAASSSRAEGRPSKSRNDDEDASGSSSKLRRARNGRGRGQGRADNDDGASDDGSGRMSSPEPDDSADDDVEEPSSDGSDGDSEGDGSEADTDGSGSDGAYSSQPHRSKKKGKKAWKDGTRRSNREGAQAKKRYDFGDGAVDSPSQSEADPLPAAANSHASRAAKRVQKFFSPDLQEDDGGASSDELSIQARPHASTSKQPLDSTTTSSRGDAEDDYQEEQQEEEDGEDAEGELRPQDLNRPFCAKCGLEPAETLLARIEARRARKKPGRKKKRDVLEEDTDAEQERIEKYGAWVECGVCCVSYHFGCLPATQKREITDKLKSEYLAKHQPEIDAEGTPVVPESRGGSGRSSKAATPTLKGLPPRAKDELDPQKAFTIAKCPACKKMGGRRCFVCGLSGKRVTEGEVTMVREDRAREIGAAVPTGGTADKAVDVAAAVAAAAADNAGDVPANGADGNAGMKDQVAPAGPGQAVAEITADSLRPGLMFRCSNCKRTAHYGCLENEEAETTFEGHCQSYAEWAICHDCYNYNVDLDVILAWAEADPLPSPSPDDVESDDEYVEKIVGETRVDERTKKTVIVPSAKDPQAAAKYLVKWQGMSYRHLDWVPHAFLAAKYQAKLSNFLARGSTVTFDAPKDDDPEDAEPDGDAKDKLGEAPLPDPTAKDKVPVAWKTIDRVLNVAYKHPRKKNETVDFAVFRKRLPEDPNESIRLVAQSYIKWCDLAYKESTFEDPPSPGEDGYEEWLSAYKAFLVANDPSMSVPRLTADMMDSLDNPRPEKTFRPLKTQPDYLTGGTLMDFQMDGVNFLRSRWWQRKGCILADEMGLGKTCQVLSFLSILNEDNGARPFLVVVPNSLVGNWMREFARWAPTMRVVPYNGDGESRRIVEDYEMFDASGSLKTHVVLATYEALQGNAAVFRRVTRWDTLVVDEGQRLKGGKTSQLFNVINSLRIGHRVILSGTPLNNNLRELFNLLAFINPSDYPDIDAVTARFADLTPELVEEVRDLLKPFFLRRTKDLVLNLPPLLEVVVPVTMTSLQRSVYRGILERNASAIQAIARKAGAGSGSGGAAGGRSRPKKSGFTNILMELRKTLCHPYLVDEDLEPRDVSLQQAHQNLTDACAKFVLLARMLPKLKAAGHRVLIFSQFKLTLNVLERFLGGLDLKFLRLDGDTPQLERQRDVDRFNAPGSDIFAYLLSTRAGGVGLNITSADVVIIYDQDFNPQMDIQAISRAHRIGQTKPVRVFKLLVKGTCEEKILNAGQKKRGLEHLIIQRIDAVDESEDMESMLQFGATAVFDDDDAEKNAIRYSDADIDDLLAKTAKPVEKKEDAASTFATAQIWVRDGGELNEFDAEKADEEAQPENLHDFWSKVVDQQQETERAQRAAQANLIGRGTRRRNQVNYKVDVVSPEKKKAGSSPSLNGGSSGDDYRDKEDVESDYEESMEVDQAELQEGGGAPKAPPLARLQDGHNGDTARGPARKRHRGDPNERRREQERIDKRKIADLRAAAASINSPEAQALLHQAHHAGSRSERVLRLRQAVSLLIDLRGHISDATPTVVSAGGTTSGDSRDTSVSTSRTPSQGNKGTLPSAGPNGATASLPAHASVGREAGSSKTANRPSETAVEEEAPRPSKSGGADSNGGKRLTHDQSAIAAAASSMRRTSSASSSGPSKATDTSLHPSSKAKAAVPTTSTKPSKSSSGYRQSELNFAKRPADEQGSTSTPPVVPAKRSATEANREPTKSTSVPMAASTSAPIAGEPNGAKKQKRVELILSDSEAEP